MMKTVRQAIWGPEELYVSFYVRGEECAGPRAGFALSMIWGKDTHRDP